MAIEGPLPGTGPAQGISRKSIQCLHANQPRDWSLEELTGMDDYGLDFKVQLLVKDEATDVFFMQIKGTANPTKSAAGDFILWDFKATTIRYYARITIPILLIVCDLSVDANPDLCPAYWVWIHDELRRIGGKSLSPDSQSVRLRVPTVNRLSRGSDFSAQVAIARELAQAGIEIDLAVEKFRPGLLQEVRASLVRDIAEGLSHRSPELLDAIAKPDGQMWVNPRPGTLAHYLVEAKGRLDAGMDMQAEAPLLMAEPMLTTGASAEVAEYWYLKGRLHALRSDYTLTRDLFLRAAQEDGQQRFWLAWAEAEMRCRHLEAPGSDLTSIAEFIPGEGAKAIAMRARLLAAGGRTADAMTLLATVDGEDVLAAKAMILIGQDREQEVLKITAEGLSLPQLDASNRRIFLLLRAHARFSLAAPWATGNVAGGVPRSEIDIGPIAGAWDEILVALDAMEASGWPTNIDLIAQPWYVCASLLGQAKRELPRVLEASRRRPHASNLQWATESLAQEVGEFELALEANSRMRESDTKTLNRIAFLHELGRHRECVELLEGALLDADRTNPLFGRALTAAALSANRLARSPLVTQCLEILDSDISMAPRRAELDYVLAASAGIGTATVALDKLEERYEELGRPDLLAQTLFRSMNPSDQVQAKKIVEIGELLGQKGPPTLSAAYHCCVAYATLNQWEDLLRVARQNVDLEGRQPKFAALEALALDKLGETDLARRLLETMITGGESDMLALNAYVNILARCGFVNEAYDVAERIMEAAKDRPVLIDCVRLAYTMAQMADPRSPRLIGLARRMGTLTDPADEELEGIYLQMLMMSVLHETSTISAADKAEFKVRSDAYFQKHPTSSVIRRFSIPTNASGDDLMRTLREVTGQTEERDQIRSKIEEEVRSGSAPFPFAWRARNVLQDVNDVAELWERSKLSHEVDHRLLLTMTLGPWKPQSAKDLTGQIPLIDLTSLLVLWDLELLDKLFELFPRIAISQWTWGELTRLTSPIAGSRCRAKCIALLQYLQIRFANILQPVGVIGDDHDLLPGSHDDIKQIWMKGGFKLYSDDVLFRIYATNAAEPSQGMCTGDLISALEELKLITVAQAARKFSQLISWGVVVGISPSREISALPVAIKASLEIEAAIRCLRDSEVFMPIANSRWGGKTPDATVLNTALVVRSLVDLPDFAPEAIAAYLDVWLETLATDGLSHTHGPNLISCCLLAACFGRSISQGSSNKIWLVMQTWDSWRNPSMTNLVLESARVGRIARLCANADLKTRPIGESARQRLCKGLINSSLRAKFEKIYFELVQPKPLYKLASIAVQKPGRGPTPRRSWWSR